MLTILSWKSLGSLERISTGSRSSKGSTSGTHCSVPTPEREESEGEESESRAQEGAVEGGER